MNNWDRLDVSQTEMEHVICAGVNFRYMKKTYTIEAEVLAPEVKAWREFVGA